MSDKEFTASEKEFIDQHSKFLELIRKYATDNKLDYAVMIGNDNHALMPWNIKNFQNQATFFEIMGELEERPAGFLRAGHFKSEEEMEKHKKILEEEGPYVPPLRH